MSAANPETPNSTISREASTQSSSAAASQGWVLPEGKIVPNTVFVGGIDDRTDETEIRSFFGRYGSVKEVKRIRNRTGVSKGYGFVSFVNDVDVQKIVGSQIHFHGKKLKLGPAIRKQKLCARHVQPRPLVVNPPPPPQFQNVRRNPNTETYLQPHITPSPITQHVQEYPTYPDSAFQVTTGYQLPVYNYQVIGLPYSFFFLQTFLFRHFLLIQVHHFRSPLDISCLYIIIRHFLLIQVHHFRSPLDISCLYIIIRIIFLSNFKKMVYHIHFFLQPFFSGISCLSKFTISRHHWISVACIQLSRISCLSKFTSSGHHWISVACIQLSGISCLSKFTSSGHHWLSVGCVQLSGISCLSKFSSSGHQWISVPCIQLPDATAVACWGAKEKSVDRSLQMAVSCLFNPEKRLINSVVTQDDCFKGKRVHRFRRSLAVFKSVGSSQLSSFMGSCWF
nr:deleted in azoospermia-like isoform X2 [Pan paniscus]